MTTPNNQLSEVLAITQGCVIVLDAARNLAEQQVTESLLLSSEEALDWATKIEEAATRIQGIAAGILELAQVAIVPAAEDKLEDLTLVEEVVEEPQTETEIKEVAIAEPIDQQKQTVEPAASAHPLEILENDLSTEDTGLENAAEKERKIKPRYSERQVKVVKRIIERIKPGEEFRQSQLNSEDLEGLTDDEKLRERGFYSSTLSKLYDDGLLGHNGKQRGGSRSILEDVDKLKVLVEAEGYIDEDGKPIPASKRTVQKLKFPKAESAPANVVPEVKVTQTRLPETSIEARDRLREEIRQTRQVAGFSRNVVRWIGVYLESAPTKAPTPSRVGEAVATELGLDPEIGRQIIRNLIKDGMLFDHRRRKGSKIISLDAPTDEEIKICHDKKIQDEQAMLPRKKYGEYFDGNDEAFKNRYGNVKGVRRSDINFERGVINLKGNEKVLVELFFESRARSGVAIKHILAEIARKYDIRIDNKQLTESVGIINTLAGSDFFVMMPAVRGLKGVKGPRVRMQGSFMEDSHARV